MNFINLNFLILIFISIPAFALNTARIIEPAELLSRLNEVSLIDARPEHFKEGHIPGSQSVDWKDWTLVKPNPWNYLLQRARDFGKVPESNLALQTRLQELGLSNRKEIVIIGHPQGYGEEGRFAWAFLYWGAERVSLLNGGFDAWKAKNYPIESGQSLKKPRGDFTLRIQAQRRATQSEVIANLVQKKRPLLDARTPEEYAGLTVSAQKRGGHIPGALLVPELALYQANGNYIEAQKLRNMTQLNHESPITYCTGGVRSALLAFLIEAKLGIVSANYDASIWEWSAEKALPLVQ